MLSSVFGSGASHYIYMRFIMQETAYKNGKAIGLLEGTGTRFATWFYAMCLHFASKSCLRGNKAFLLNSQKVIVLLKLPEIFGSKPMCFCKSFPWN